MEIADLKTLHQAVWATRRKIEDRLAFVMNLCYNRVA